MWGDLPLMHITVEYRLHQRGSSQPGQTECCANLTEKESDSEREISVMSKYSMCKKRRETYSGEVVDLKVLFKRVSYCHTAKLKHLTAFLLSHGADLEVGVLGC